MKYRIKDTDILIQSLRGVIIEASEIKEVKPYSGKPYFMVHGTTVDNNYGIVILPLELLDKMEED